MSGQICFYEQSIANPVNLYMEVRIDLVAMGELIKCFTGTSFQFIMGPCSYTVVAFSLAKFEPSHPSISLQSLYSMCKAHIHGGFKMKFKMHTCYN